MPIANTAKANSPATGRKASAACAEVWICVMPCSFSVTAVATTMHRAMTFEKVMPTTVSSLMRDRCSATYSGCLRSSRAFGRRWPSSTSCEACQKNR